MAPLRVLVALLLGVVLLAGCAGSKETTQAASTEDTDKKSDDDEKSDDDKKKNGIKPYDEVVTDEMTHDEGLFDVHRDGQKVLYEISNDLLDKELLLVTRIARTADNIGYGGMKANTQVVRWQRQDDNVLLRRVSHENVAGEVDIEEPFVVRHLVGNDLVVGLDAVFLFVVVRLLVGVLGRGGLGRFFRAGASRHQDDPQQQGDKYA